MIELKLEANQAVLSQHQSCWSTGQRATEPFAVHFMIGMHLLNRIVIESTLVDLHFCTALGVILQLSTAPRNFENEREPLADSRVDHDARGHSKKISDKSLSRHLLSAAFW